MKLKTIIRMLLIGGVALLLIGLVAPLIMLIATPSQPGMGIIGGAGAPSYWFTVYAVMGGWPVYADFFGGLAILISLVMLLRNRKR